MSQSDDGDDYKRVNITVPQDTLNEWDEWNPYPDRSKMIRTAVSNEIDRQSGNTGGDAGVTDEVIDDLVASVRNLVGQVDNLSGRIETVETAVSQLQEADGSESPVDLTSSVRAVLPNEDTLPPERNGYTVDEVARRLGADAEAVSDELDQLVANVRNVKQTTEDDVRPDGIEQYTVYYVEEGGY